MSSLTRRIFKRNEYRKHPTSPDAADKVAREAREEKRREATHP